MYEFLCILSLSCCSDVLNSQNSDCLHTYTCTDPMYQSVFSFFTLSDVLNPQVQIVCRHTIECKTDVRVHCCCPLSSWDLLDSHLEIMSQNQRRCHAAGQHMRYILCHSAGLDGPPHTQAQTYLHANKLNTCCAWSHTHIPATHCNILLHTATHCNTLQHTTTHLTPTLHGRRWSTH